jgi:tetratricopeptide (TPR) repeat protein
MIVKNESRIIERFLNSVLPIIDTYCICDTGSTDNTKEIIEDFFKKNNVPGKIVEEPFQNFAHNRNFALKACLGMSDYILLLDADMILDIKNFKKDFNKDYDSFYILQGDDGYYYPNTRIIRNNGLFSYEGVTHEFVNFPENTKTWLFDKSEIFIIDVGDGGSKADKFERDVRLLIKGIEEDAGNRTRYYFYLANSYFDLGQYENAIKYYEKRIECKGWIQEVWFSNYKLGHCYKNMNKIGQAIYYWLECFNVLPERLENLYEIINYYRIIGKYKLAFYFYTLAKEFLKKDVFRENYLFLHKDVYSYKLDYQYSIIGYYLGIQNINDEIVSILNNSLNLSITNSLFNNMKYYKNILSVKYTIICDDQFVEKVNNEEIVFYSSSSCLIPKKGGGYKLNIRYVNYYITENGSYLNCDKNIITLNRFVELDDKFESIISQTFDIPFDNKRYIGVEDVKIFNDVNSDDILYIGTGLHDDGFLGIVYGKYDIVNKVLIPIEINQTFTKSECEKNWVFVNYMDCTHIIYSWSPLLICKLNEETRYIDIVAKRTMPKLFNYVRGSTCGYKYNNEVWFVCHLVSYENPRHYYHIIVVMDDNLNLLRYSAPFKFEGEPIEYCLSILVEEERILMNYSAWDRSTRINFYDKAYIETLLVYK